MRTDKERQAGQSLMRQIKHELEERDPKMAKKMTWRFGAEARKFTKAMLKFYDIDTDGTKQ